MYPNKKRENCLINYTCLHLRPTFCSFNITEDSDEEPFIFVFCYEALQQEHCICRIWRLLFVDDYSQVNSYFLSSFTAYIKPMFLFLSLSANQELSNGNPDFCFAMAHANQLPLQHSCNWLPRDIRWSKGMPNFFFTLISTSTFPFHNWKWNINACLNCSH